MVSRESSIENIREVRRAANAASGHIGACHSVAQPTLGFNGSLVR